MKALDSLTTSNNKLALNTRLAQHFYIGVIKTKIKNAIKDSLPLLKQSPMEITLVKKKDEQDRNVNMPNIYHLKAV